MSAAVELVSVTKDYGRIRALDAIDLAIPEGALFGLIGPNGAGKTTAFSLLSGFLHPTSGEVRVRGVPLTPRRPPVGQVLALPQDAQLPERRRVEEVLVMLARFSGATREDATRAARSALERVGLGGFGQRKILALSHGQRRRVGIAQTLLGEREVILLDEPTAGLDPGAAAELRGLIQELKGERTVVISSHNLAEIEQVCTHAAILDKGKLVTGGTIAAIRSTGSQVTVHLGKAPADLPGLLATLAAWPEVKSVTASEDGLALALELKDERQADVVVSALLRHLLEAGLVVRGVDRGKSLEQRFLEVTARAS